MRTLFACLIIVLITTACYKSDDKAFDGKNDIQFDYAQTTDKTFCNLDSIIPSDCSGGDFYFTKKGNVFFNFFCMGADSVSYSIGKYAITDSLITCVFTQEFSYYSGEHGESEDGKPIDPNLGRLRNARQYTVRLRKTKCELVPYYFLSDRNEIYVLRKPPREGSIDFIAAVKEIKILSDL